MPRGRLRQAATNAEQRPLRFEEWLVLNQWLLGLFGVSKFEHLAAKLKAPELEDFDENNVTRFYHALCLYIRLDWRPALPDNQLLAYDEDIVRHWKQITERLFQEVPILNNFLRLFHYCHSHCSAIYLHSHETAPKAQG